MIPRLHVSLLAPQDVVRHLGKQEEQWKEGHSAHALATVWFESNDFPPRVKTVLQSNPVFQQAELVDAFMEREVELGSKGRPSQTDVLAIAGVGPERLAIVAVEGKAGEPFDKLVAEWRDGSKGKEARLGGLCEMLNLKTDRAIQLRYQLLHRAVSAILEAKRYRTDLAVLLVHSFSEDDKGFKDFCEFLQGIGFSAPSAGVLTGPMCFAGVNLYAGWVQDKAHRGASPQAYLDDLRNYTQVLSQWCERVRNWCDSRAFALSSDKVE
jgi:hypothetical protein